MRYRMYGLVNYQLTGIQKGIQFGHAVVEYALKYGHTEEYKSWATNDKTFVILDGGTTNNNPNKLGTLNKYADQLENDFNYNIARFTEEDLGDQLTAFVFILPETIYDDRYFSNDPELIKNIYNDYQHLYDNIDYEKYEYILKLRNWVKKFKKATN